MSEEAGQPRVPDETFHAVASVARVLGNADRLRILDVLIRREVSVAELAERLGRAPNAVSQHLNHMQAHGIVGKTRRGRRVYYHVVDPVATNLLRCMWENAPRPGRGAENRSASAGQAGAKPAQHDA